MIKHRQFSDEEMRTIDVPVLLVFGEYEVCVDHRKVVERARECLRQLDVQIVAEAGHALQGEKATIVDKLVVDFLKA